MSVKAWEKYQPNASSPSPQYPYGSLRQETALGMGDGTPLDVEWGNDFEAFKQTAFSRSGLVPSGNTDTVTNSEMFNAMQDSTTRSLWERSAAESGYNLVAGSFEEGSTLVNANDVLWSKKLNKIFSGPAGAVAPRTDPTVGGFTEIVVDYSVRAGRGIIKRGHFQNYSYFKHFESQPSGNGSRLYSLPTTDHVTDGVGGVFKVFGDDFSKDVDYRDMGWYFSANQSNYAMGPGFDTGTWGNGVFWLNSKVGPTPSSTYGNKNPDIGFSFDDGVVVPGRIVRFGDYNFHWVIGPLLPQIAQQTSQIGLESQKDFAFLKGKKIRWETTIGTADSYIEFGADLDEFRVIIRGVTVMVWNRSVGIDYDKGVANGSWPQPLGPSSHTAGSTSVSAANKSYATITAGQAIATITNGRDGQFFTLHFSGASSVDSSAGNIRLKGNISQSFVANDTLLLQKIGTTWREVSITKA